MSCKPQANSCEPQAKADKKRIDRHMTIEAILGMFPYKAQRLSQEITNAGLHCVGCHAATWETLEGGMLGHGKTQCQINDLVERLNTLLDEQVDLNTISMTKKAAKKFLEILAEEGKQGWAMRFGDQVGGCSGFEYLLDFSEKAESDDTIFESHGVEIHVNNVMAKRLLGSEIDFVDGLHNSGFKISNPNVKSSCGCGKSQGY